MNELTLDGKTYVSSKRAAEITGYAKDYVGQLCREGHVEARLVGRNWYVLESSIREHRYGKKSNDSVAANMTTPSRDQDWISPRYVPEETAYIPPIASKIAEAEDKNDFGVEFIQEETPRAPLLTDMQTAWQEWFEREKQEPVQAHEIELPQINEASDAEAESVSEDVPVAIYKTEDTLSLRDVKEEPEEGFIVEERIVETPKIQGIQSLLLQGVLLGVCLLAIAITFVGTGLAGKFTGVDSYRLSAIDYLTGTSVINKQ